MLQRDEIHAIGMGVAMVDTGIKARYIPVTELPTTSMQQGAIAIIFLMTFLAFAVWAVRVYSRVTTKQFGIGTCLTLSRRSVLLWTWSSQGMTFD